jgi:hypothetical protein
MHGHSHDRCLCFTVISLGNLDYHVRLGSGHSSKLAPRDTAYPAVRHRSTQGTDGKIPSSGGLKWRIG